MNPGSPDSEFGNFKMHDFIVPNDAYTNERQRLQEPFVEFSHAAETPRVRDDEMSFWIGNPLLQAENEILDVDFPSLMENISDEFLLGEQQLIQPVTPQHAEATLGQPEEFVDGEQVIQPVTEATLWQPDEFLHEQQLIEPVTEVALWQPDEFLGEQQLIEPVTEATIWQPHEFVHDEQQLITQGLPQQGEATLWQPEPAVNLFYQPVTTPAPQAENALWPVLEPPLDISHYMPLEPGMVEPPGLNTNHQYYFNAPAVQNSSWPVSPFPDSFAPILYEPVAEATSVIAAVEGAEATPVVAAVEGNKEKGSTSIVQEENQVGEHSKVKEQDHGIGRSTPLKRMRENHNGQERRRRDKLKERIELLRELVPGCKKADKASVLEETCTYLKSLQNHVNMLSNLGCKMRMSMAMGMNMHMAMVPFPAFVPGSTWQNPANTAAQLPTLANINGQYLGVFPTEHLQAENNATLQPSSSDHTGETEDTEEPNK